MYGEYELGVIMMIGGCADCDNNSMRLIEKRKKNGLWIEMVIRFVRNLNNIETYKHGLGFALQIVDSFNVPI